jgi:hypothetical protein
MRITTRLRDGRLTSGEPRGGEDAAAADVGHLEALALAGGRVAALAKDGLEVLPARLVGGEDGDTVPHADASVAAADRQETGGQSQTVVRAVTQ